MLSQYNCEERVNGKELLWEIHDGRWLQNSHLDRHLAFISHALQQGQTLAGIYQVPIGRGWMRY